MSTTVLLLSVASYEPRWLPVALALVVFAIYVATCRQVLGYFSRKRLLEITPAPRQAEVEAHLENEDSYSASLRSLDLLLRLSLVLSLALSRFTSRPTAFTEGSVLSVSGECLLLALEIILVILVFLEILPGILARVRPEERLLRKLRAIRRVNSFFAPLRSISAGLVRAVVVALGGKGERPTADILEEEILSAAEEGEREGLLESRDIDMIESIISFGNVEVSDVMTPRTEMVCLDVDDPLEKNMRRAIDCGHSRIPVFHESKDNIIGLLYVKDLLRYWDSKETLQVREVLRAPHFVPRTKKVGELLQEFKEQRFHIAIILDEFGGTLGLVTIEDIIEEIVGEITDEYELVEKPPLRRLSPGMADVDGSLRIEDFNEQLKTSIPETEAYETVGGFIVSQMGRIPAVGEALEFDSVQFEVAAADERRIHRLRIRLPQKEDGAEAEQGV